MILVLTPLPVEKSALIEALGGSTHTTHVDGIEVSWVGDGLGIAVGGHGKVQFALTASHVLAHLRPRCLVCAGACGALIEELKPFDVVVGQVTLEHDYRLRFVERDLPQFSGDEEILQNLSARKASYGFGLHIGRIASGDEDIVERTRAQELRAQTGAIAVAWEGAGGARAARFHRLPFLELRAVTDAADAKAPNDFARFLKGGMKNLASVLRDVLR